MKRLQMTLASCAVLLAPAHRAALAQQAQEPAAAPGPAAEQPAPAHADTGAAPAAPTVEQRVTELEGKFEGVSEPFLEMQSTVAAMKRLKFAGYIQGRYEWHDDSDFGLNPTNNAPRNLNRFL